MEVYATLPNASGEQLWLVQLSGSYFDNDPRGPGTNPVDIRIWVIARSHSGALRKADARIQDFKQSYHYVKDFNVVAYPVPLETLKVARDASNDGRMGYFSTSRLSGIELSLPEDQTRFRLAVCLIEHDESEQQD